MSTWPRDNHHEHWKLWTLLVDVVGEVADVLDQILHVIDIIAIAIAASVTWQMRALQHFYHDGPLRTPQNRSCLGYQRCDHSDLSSHRCHDKERQYPVIYTLIKRYFSWLHWFPVIVVQPHMVLIFKITVIEFLWWGARTLIYVRSKRSKYVRFCWLGLHTWMNHRIIYIQLKAYKYFNYDYGNADPPKDIQKC